GRDAGRFERAVEPVIQEAVGIARGLLAGRLPRREAPGSGAPEEAAQEPLDWLILSGKTSNMDLVHRVVRQEFLNSPHFVWNPERVTFVPQYAKLAPSAGACYAEKMRRTPLPPAPVQEHPAKGPNHPPHNNHHPLFL